MGTSRVGTDPSWSVVDKYSRAHDAQKNVTRHEFVQATTEIRENVRQLEIDFRRIAQMQADIDAMKATLVNTAA